MTSPPTRPLIDIAVEYAKRGYRVFPVHGIRNGACTCGKPECGSAGKHPQTGHGFKDASNDPAQLAKLFNSALPEGTNIGIATGAVSGFWVLDVDGPEGEKSLAALEAEHDPIPATLTQNTGRGRHLFFRYVTPIKSRTDGIGRKLDVRGDGGYIVAAPSTHALGVQYRFVDPDAPIADAPAWLSILASTTKRNPNPKVGSQPLLITATQSTRYGLAALQSEAEEVAAAPEGQRNETLNKAAFKIGQLIPDGIINEHEAKAELARAAQSAGLGANEINKTLESGITAGISNPREKASPHQSTDDGRGGVEFTHEKIKGFLLGNFATGAPPDRKFLLKPFIPAGVVGLLFGPGGVGKSMVALDLCMSVANLCIQPRGNLPYLFGAGAILGGLIPVEAAGATIFITLEDDNTEIHRRVHALDPDGSIRKGPAYVIPALELEGFDPTLVTSKDRKATLTTLGKTGLQKIINHVRADSGFPVSLLILDPAGDFLDVDENDATYVKLLMRQLRKVSYQNSTTIVLLGHVSKANRDNESFFTMRGSSAWIANSRFAISIWPPVESAAKEEAEKFKCDPSQIVIGCLVKANHQGAPVGVKKTYIKDAASGRLTLPSPGGKHANTATDDELMNALVDICGKCAEAGMPFTISGKTGLFENREDLPPLLRSASKHRLETLGKLAVEKGLLVKGKLTGAQQQPTYLDLANGPIATGRLQTLAKGSRDSALKRFKENAAKAAAAEQSAPLAHPIPVPGVPGGNGFELGTEKPQPAAEKAVPADPVPKKRKTAGTSSAEPASRVPRLTP